jgi:hypothetical protein
MARSILREGGVCKRQDMRRSLIRAQREALSLLGGRLRSTTTTVARWAATRRSRSTGVELRYHGVQPGS